MFTIAALDPFFYWYKASAGQRNSYASRGGVVTTTLRGLSHGVVVGVKLDGRKVGGWAISSLCSCWHEAGEESAMYVTRVPSPK